MIKVYIKKNEAYSKPLVYILSLFSKNKSLQIKFIDEKINAEIIFDHTEPNSIPINAEFYESLLVNKQFNHEIYFKKSPALFFLNSDRQDWLGTAFYLVNSFQEYNNNSSNDMLDAYGRFKYEKSYQHKFNCVEKNLVQEYFDNFAQEYPIFSTSLSSKKQTRVFISHDIDTIYGSFLQDGLWALKKGRLDIILKLIINEVMLNPNWKNMDSIIKLHSEHDLKSTFFWIATKKIAANKVKNADYSIAKIDKQLLDSTSNGLHKSSYTTSFTEELNMLPFKTELNRYHFLKFNLPNAWNDMQACNLKLDASLGFAERYGFRNNYGLPFKPYNITNQEPYNFIEVPLNIMDGTLHRYMKIPLKETAKSIIDFIEKNKTNAIVSILWHNTYFTEYKYVGYLQEYKKVLLYLNETGIKSVTPEEIINEFSND